MKRLPVLEEVREEREEQRFQRHTPTQ